MAKTPKAVTLSIIVHPALPAVLPEVAINSSVMVSLHY